MRPARAVSALAVAVVVVAGCAGSPTRYTLGATRACLAAKPGLRLGGPLDFVASTALGGALAVRTRENAVVISFGLDEAEAGRLATAYRRFRGRNIGIEDVLRPRRNAVLLWRAHPSPEDEAAVTGCLK